MVAGEAMAAVETAAGVMVAVPEVAMAGATVAVTAAGRRAALVAASAEQPAEERPLTRPDKRCDRKAA